ncbi:uroporphyrinogen-III C-methyltransferase [Effusibacillus lacus]|uniref:Uroporphyrinogen-III C-methyltransferase n=1 Tax=Effusibacillus lacus TaxID=1348429 RepID=A0A292YDR7_9BACL|nr:uroporphyrinogen-III C-methyltransferase [Effusibacillus lacus]TCS76475.1 uroporphyrinogen III methyltransferase/synthase [Effusibacillus lacus]GAX90502.1 uroporphyrinogen-III C-methyltransferase [Effusibacillus lacus]
MVSGKVYLVGAGPGDPGLITVKGRNAIQTADVVLYDRLCSPRLLAFAPSGAELIYSGKTPDQHTLPQEEINRLLAEYAKQGKTVVRLKGGDPSVFGRVGEEMEHLAEHGIEYEVIPGVSSAIGVPIYAGIPVTYRGVASSFAVVTGHEDPAKGTVSVDWERVAVGSDTLIFLMGVGRIASIADNLIRYGRPADTPVALTRWGTWAEQETLTGTLSDIAEKVEQANFRNPAVIVVGDVVRLRDKIAWFEKKPLFGKRVMITRARTQASELARLIEEQGGESYEFPVIRLVPPSDWGPVDHALHNLETFDWIVFTSVNGVEFFFGRMLEMEIDVRRIRGKIASVGATTEEALRQRGLIADLIPQQFVGEALFEELASHVRSGQKVLLPRADIARKALPEALRQIGCKVVEVDVYENVPVFEHAQEALQMLSDGDIHAITFTSSSTVKNFVKILEGEDLHSLLQRVTIASIGPITTETAEKMGLRVDVTAETHTIQGLVEALIAHEQRNSF